eukprot:COSAG02_NODE_405_length_23022_cov_14.617764_16_plen_197_part_00
MKTRFLTDFGKPDPSPSRKTQFQRVFTLDHALDRKNTHSSELVADRHTSTCRHSPRSAPSEEGAHPLPVAPLRFAVVARMLFAPPPAVFASDIVGRIARTVPVQQPTGGTERLEVALLRGTQLLLRRVRLERLQLCDGPVSVRCCSHSAVQRAARQRSSTVAVLPEATRERFCGRADVPRRASLEDAVDGGHVICG